MSIGFGLFLAAASIGTDLLLRVGGPLAVPPGTEVANAAVVDGNATIDGIVRGGFAVIRGEAVVNGRVDGTIVCAGGRVTLGPTARVGADLILVQCELDRQAGAAIAGRTVRESGLDLGRRVFIFLWAGITIVVVSGAVVFAGLGGTVLERAMTAMRRVPGQTAVFGLATCATLPIVAMLAFLTVIAAPLGLAILLVLAPVLGFLGYLTAATAFGTGLAALLNLSDRTARPYRAAAIGAVGAQLVALIPAIGAPVVMLAGMFGVGALANLAWHHWRPANAAAVPG